MSTRFSRIGLVGRLEDARVADSMDAFARALLARGLTVAVEERSGAGPFRGGSPGARAPSSPNASTCSWPSAATAPCCTRRSSWLASRCPCSASTGAASGSSTDVSPTEMTASFDAVLAGEYEQDVRSLLAATLTGPTGRAQLPRAQRHRDPAL
jgi:hypothetical protein